MFLSYPYPEIRTAVKNDPPQTCTGTKEPRLNRVKIYLPIILYLIIMNQIIS